MKSSEILDRGVKKKSTELDAKRIALAVCGGIGAVETVKCARELRRLGASVRAFFTPSAIDFITPLSLEWATGESVSLQPGANVDHLDPFHLVIVAPATLSTISKCAVGIADNAVTLLVAGQLGRKGKLLFVPTMNSQLLRHPLYEEHKKRLCQWGAHFFESTEEEGRIKMPSPESLAAAAAKLIG